MIDEDTKGLIKLQIEMLKNTMLESGLIFAFAIDKENANNSQLVFLEKSEYFATGRKNGFSISLTELNKKLL